jgi:serine/threonine protein kinase
MAPEIHQLGAVSAKTDVYSFGILLIEIIRAKRNATGKEQDDEDSKRFFPSWAKEKFRRGRYLDAVHELKASFPLIPGFQTEEAKKLLCIAIACIHVSYFYPV